MTAYIIRRLLWMIPLLWAVITITFILMHMVEGGPFERERELPPATINALNQKYGLDKPVFSVDVWNSQYGQYIGDLLPFKADIPPFKEPDLGVSFRNSDRSVSDLIRQGFWVSFQLGLLAFIFAVIGGMTLGSISALNHNGPLDYAGVFFSTAGAAMPNFILAAFLIVIFSVELGWTDVLGWGGPGFSEAWNPTAWNFRKVVLPVVALGVLPAAYFARITRASMLEVLGQDYIRTARSKGLSEWVVIMRHTVKNAMVPILTVMGPYLAFLITGSFIVEHTFSIPGVGRRFVEAVIVRDYGMIMGTIVFYTVFIAFINLIVDVLYAVVDPRIRYG
jgi:oligopeptide transport system permease protein